MYSQDLVTVQPADVVVQILILLLSRFKVTLFGQKYPMEPVGVVFVLSKIQVTVQLELCCMPTSFGFVLSRFDNLYNARSTFCQTRLEFLLQDLNNLYNVSCARQQRILLLLSRFEIALAQQKIESKAAEFTSFCTLKI